MDPTPTPIATETMAPVDNSNLPQVLDTHGYFFASYTVVWIAILVYLLYLARRIGALESRSKGNGATRT